MRKYLITGVLALAAGGFLTSCHDTEGAYSSIVEQKLQAYEQVFKEEFGEIDPNQDWGFGETSTSPARTRATGEFANHVGAYPDANMWTSKGFLAPPPLTTSQKLRAQYYFQMNHITNPNRPNYGQIDFFMQQVYDGGDDPMTNKSLEKYPSADYTPENNNYITSGEHMDHLTCGPDHTHTYNFNNGNCSTNPNVANRDQTDVNNTSQQHSDKIQLMLNTKTSCFGYANSEASYVRDDRWTLVGAATIDAFCDSDAGFQAWLANRLPANEEDIKCDDEYHRSYIGFDFDMLPDEKIFAGGTETWEEASESNGWKRTLISRTYAEYDYYRYDLYGAKYHYLSANGNQYCGQSRTIDPEPDEAAALTLLTNGWLPATGSANKRWIKVGGCNDGYYSDWIVTFMPADSGFTPETTTIDIEPGGGTKKGSRITTYMWELTETQKGRIMCEDLGVIKASDIDFNDLVFDAYIYNAQKKKKVVTVDENNNIVSGPTITDENESTRLAEIYILAAGGTLPISVAGERVKDHFSDENRSGSLSDAFIVNTCTRDGDGDGGAYSNPWWNYNTAQKIEKFENNITLKDIKVIVRYGDKILELYSQPGLAPHKICVPLDLASGVNVKWPLERVVIKEAYEDFTKYVKNEDETIVFTPDANSESGDPDSDGTNPNGVSYFNKEQSNTCWTRTEKINPDKLFNETVNYTPRNLNSDDGRYYIISTSSEEVDIPDTSKGYQQGETILVRRRH